MGDRARGRRSGRVCDHAFFATTSSAATQWLSPEFVYNPSKGTGEIAATNTMTGSFNNPSALGAIQAALNLSPQFNLGFGGNGRSAFIDDKNLRGD